MTSNIIPQPNLLSYKCRAECLYDVELVMKFLQKKLSLEQFVPGTIETQTLEHNGQTIPIPDVDWEFDCTLDHETLTDLLFSQPLEDCHVLIESLKPRDQYDGERDNQFC